MIYPSAYLLVSHGSRDPRPQAAIEAIALRVAAQLERLPPGNNHPAPLVTPQFESDRPLTVGVLAQPALGLAPLVGTAVLELHPLPLHAQIQRFAEQAIALGYRSVKILPLFLLKGVHVSEDIPSEVAIAQHHLGHQIVLETSPPVGHYRPIQDLILEGIEFPATAAKILLAHGSRHTQGNDMVKAIAQRLEAQTAYWSLPPNLDSQVVAQVQAGYSDIVVLPYFLFAGGITDAIAQTVHQLAMQFPQVRFQVAHPLSAHPQFADYLVEWLRSL